MPLFWCRYCSREIFGEPLLVRGRGRRATLFYDAAHTLHRIGQRPPVKSITPVAPVAIEEPVLEVQSLEDFMVSVFRSAEEAVPQDEVVVED